MRLKSEFHEDYASPHTDPLDAREADFPFEEIFAHLDGVKAQAGDDNYALLGEAFTALVSFVVGAAPVRRGLDRAVGRRFIALAWALRPDLIEGSPSLSTIAKELGCHKVSLSIHSAAASRRFGIRNRAQSHGWNFKPNALSAQETERSQDEHT